MMDVQPLKPVDLVVGLRLAQAPEAKYERREKSAIGDARGRRAGETSYDVLPGPVAPGVVMTPRASALCAEQRYDGDVRIRPQLTREPHFGGCAHAFECFALVRSGRRTAAGALDDAHSTG